jgi:hypothetical protein
MLQRAQRTSGNVRQTFRCFEVSRALYYWKERYEKRGVAGLRDLPRRPHKIRFRIPPEIVSLILRIREERRYGAVRVSLYLQRHYHATVFQEQEQHTQDRKRAKLHAQAKELGFQLVPVPLVP